MFKDLGWNTGCNIVPVICNSISINHINTELWIATSISIAENLWRNCRHSVNTDYIWKRAYYHSYAENIDRLTVPRIPAHFILAYKLIVFTSEWAYIEDNWMDVMYTEFWLKYIVIFKVILMFVLRKYKNLFLKYY